MIWGTHLKLILGQRRGGYGKGKKIEKSDQSKKGKKNRTNYKKKIGQIR